MAARAAITMFQGRPIGPQTFRVSTEARIRARFMFGGAAHGYSIISLTPTHTHSHVICSLPATLPSLLKANLFIAPVSHRLGAGRSCARSLPAALTHNES